MIEVRYVSYSKQFDDHLLRKLMRLLPDKLVHKLSRYTRWEDRHAGLLGTLLLKHQIKEMEIDVSLNDLKYTNFGKPYFDYKVDFNISHSGAFVIIVMSKNYKVGVDIEHIVPLELHYFQDQFVQEEWADIINSTDSFSRFYHYWTAKEAVVKANGKGLNIPLKGVIIKHGITMVENELWFYYKINISEHYVVHVSSNKKLDHGYINIKKVILTDLLLSELEHCCKT